MKLATQARAAKGVIQVSGSIRLFEIGFLPAK